MVTPETITYELRGRLQELEVGKTHISVRYEQGPRIARIGICIAEYNWDSRAAVIDQLIEFEEAHADEFAVEFDVVPLEAITDPIYAEA